MKLAACKDPSIAKKSDGICEESTGIIANKNFCARLLMSLMQQHVLYVLLCTVLELSYKKVFTFSTVDEILELSIQEVFKEAERRGKIAYSMGCKLRSLYSTRNNLVINPNMLTYLLMWPTINQVRGFCCCGIGRARQLQSCCQNWTLVVRCKVTRTSQFHITVHKFTNASFLNSQARGFQKFFKMQ